MPDESCRRCGGSLIDYARCTECRKILLKMCKKCCGLVPYSSHVECFRFFETTGIPTG